MATPSEIREDAAYIAEDIRSTAAYFEEYGADDLRATVSAVPEIAGELFDAAKDLLVSVLGRERHAPLTTDTFLGRT